MSLFLTIVLSLLTVYGILSYVILAGLLIGKYTEEGLDWQDIVLWLFSPIILPLLIGRVLYEV